MAGREKLYTSHGVGELMQVDPSSVVKWVNDGILPSYRTPGGHRRIRASDLLAFIRKTGGYVPPELNAPTRKVLFVDDEGHVLGAMKRAMKAFADTVNFQTAQSGLDALVRIGTERPDVLVLDVAMPGVDGLEVLAKLKANPDTSGIEVVVMSVSVTPQLEKKALDLGARAVRQKPISAEDLVGLVTSAPGARDL